MPTDARNVRWALGAAFLLYLGLGLPDGVLGTVWPNLRDHFDQSDSGFGWIIFASATGYAVGGVASSRVTERFGVGPVLPASTLLAAGALALIAGAGTWSLLLVGFALVGVGWGVGDASVNAWMALTQGPREMGLLHASYGVGAFLGPLLATPFVADGTAWRGPYVVCVAVVAASVAVLVRARVAFDAAPRTAEVVDQPGPARGSDRLLVTMIGWFALYVGIEVAVGQWAYTLLTEHRGVDDVAAGFWAASYWGGLMAGRLVLAVVGNRTRPVTTMRITSLVAVLAAAVLWIDDGVLGALMLPVLGVTFAPMFPVLMGRTAVYLGEARATRAVGYQIGATPLGFTTIPALIGVLADRRDVGVAAPVVFVALIGLGGLWLAIERQVHPPGLSRPAT